MKQIKKKLKIDLYLYNNNVISNQDYLINGFEITGYPFGKIKGKSLYLVSYTK